MFVKCLKHQGLEAGYKFLWKVGFDATTLSADLAIIDSEGNKYPATLNKSAQIIADKLPLTVEEMNLSVYIPGHFTVNKPFKV